MEHNPIDDIFKICSILNKNSVEYMIAGGTAVAIYGFYRMTTNLSGKPADKHDLDFWYNPNYKNYYNLLKALEELGQDVTKFMSEKVPQPKKSFFRLEFDRFTIDFLPEFIGHPKFWVAFEKREIANINGIEIPVIPYNDLILNKQITGRPKDLNDINQLEAKRSK